MSNIPNVKCLEGHISKQLCSLSNCKWSAAVCSEKECQYYVNHKKCAKIDIQSFLETLINNDTYYAIKQQVEDFYKEVLTLVQKQKNQYFMLLEKAYLRLSKEKKTFYDRLMDEKNKGFLDSQLVGKILIDDKKIDSQKLKNIQNSVQNYASELMCNIKNELKKFRYYWDNNKLPLESHLKIIQDYMRLQEYQFQNFTVSPQIKVSVQNKKIKLLQKCNDYPMSLIFPSIQQNAKIQIKVIRGGSYNFIGIGSLNQTVKNNYKWNDNLAVVDGGNGKIFHPNSERHKKETSFRFQSGDVINMFYSNSILKIMNRTQNHTLQLRPIKKLNQNNSLHFCIVTHNKEDEYEILKQ